MKTKKKMLSMAVCLAYAASLGIPTVSAATPLVTDVSDGDAVMFDRGVIRLDTALGLNELKKGLKLVKGDGSSIKGGQYIRQIENDETYEYELVFGALEDGESYTLYYNKDDVIMFTANGYLINETFDDWTDADIAKLTSENGKDGLYMMLKENYADRNPVVSLKDSNGGKYLAVESGWSSELSKPNTRTRLYASDMGLLRQSGDYEDLLYVSGDWKWYGTSNDESVGKARFRRMGALASKVQLHDNKEGLTGLTNSAESTGKNWLNVGSNGDLNSVEGKTFDNGWHTWNMLYQKSNYALDMKFDTTRVSGGWGNFDACDYDSVLLAYMDTNADNNDGAFAVDNLKIEKVKGPNVLYTSAVYNNNKITEGSGQLEIYFSTDVLESSLSGITLTDSENTDYKTGITYDSESRCAILSYENIADGTEYALNFPGTVYSEKSVKVNANDQRAAMQAKALAFTGVKESTEPETGTTADIKDGSAVPFDKGIITLTSTDFNLDYAINHLELTKADGSAIKGTYYVRQGDNGIDVIFGDLEDNTAYTLSCGSYELNFTAKGYAVNETFDDWTDEDIAKLTSENGKDGLYMMLKENYADRNPVVSLKNSNSGKYLAVESGWSSELSKPNTRTRLYASDMGLLRLSGDYEDLLYVSGDWKWYGTSDEASVGKARFRSMGGLASKAQLHDNKEGLTGLTNSAELTGKNWLNVGSSGELNSVEGKTFDNGWHTWNMLYQKGNYALDMKFDATRVTGGWGGFTASDYDSVLLAYMDTNADNNDGAFAVDNLKIEKIKSPKILKTSAEDNIITSGNGKIEIYFSTDVLESSLADITLTDSNDVDYKSGITYDSQARCATVSYEGISADSQYTLTLPNTVYSEKSVKVNENAQRAAMQAKIVSLTSKSGGGEIETPFVCLATDLSSTAGVDTAIGKITVSFNEEVDDATITNITMTDGSGAAVPNLAVTASGNTCILTFSLLNSGTRYIITVPESVKSMSGKAAKEKIFTFRTKSDYMVDLDFENYTVAESAGSKNISGTHPNPDEGLLYTSNNIANDVSNMYVMAEGSNKFLRVYSDKSPDGKAMDNKANVLVDLDGKNSLSVEMKVRWASSDGSYGDSSISGTIGRIDAPITANVFTGNRSDGSIGSNSSGRLVQTGQGVGTWLDIKLVYTPDTDGIYRVDGYYNGEYITTVKENTKITSISNILLQHIYNKSLSCEAWADIDDIKIKYVTEPGIVGTNLTDNTLPVNGQILELYFSDEMNQETVIDNNITVTCGGELVNTTGIYMPAENKFVISFPDYLTPDKEYKVNFNGVKSADRIFMTTPFTFRSGSIGLTLNSAAISETNGGGAIDKIPASGNVAAAAEITNNTGSEEKAVVVLASYDDAGRVLNIVSKELTVSTGNTKTVSCEMSGVSDAYEVRMYLWNGLNKICPILTTPIKIN